MLISPASMRDDYDKVLSCSFEASAEKDKCAQLY